MAEVLPPHRQSVGVVAIDTPEDAVMVTPLELLSKSPANIDCLFCNNMAYTKVQLQTQEEPPSGYVEFDPSLPREALIVDSLVICLTCLVCWPLLCCLPAWSKKKHTWVHHCSHCNALVAIKSEDGGIDVKKPQPARLVPTKFGAAREQEQSEKKATTVDTV